MSEKRNGAGEDLYPEPDCPVAMFKAFVIAMAPIHRARKESQGQEVAKRDIESGLRTFNPEG